MVVDYNALAIAMAIIVPILAFCIGVTLYLAFRHYRTYHGQGYNRVDHELDGEEIEFKRMIESRVEDESDEEELFGEDVKDLSFDSKDMDRLNMLERMRNNLVASAGDSLLKKGDRSSIDDNSESDIENKDPGNDSVRL